MFDQSPESPEARRKRLAKAGHRLSEEVRSHVGQRTILIVKRVAVGVYTDGFIHAGNLAFLTLLAVFPFFIVAVAIASLLGQTADGVAAVNVFLANVPPDVAQALRQPIRDVLTARTGNLLWFGAAVGLWTVASLIETIRDIVRRAYGVPTTKPFWHYRLASIGITALSVLMILFAFSLQVIISALEAGLSRWLPFAEETLAFAQATQLVPAIILFVSMRYLFMALTPSRYRGRAFPKWPGAAVTTLWWYGTSLLLPVVLAQFGGYNLTYGGLAGAMATLIFFFIIGLGVVIGAEINAALTDFPDGNTGGGALDLTAHDKETGGE